MFCEQYVITDLVMIQKMLKKFLVYTLYNHLLIIYIFYIFIYICRYYGVNDPVAEKMMNRASEMPKLEKPEDQTITTLYVGNLNDITTEKDLR